MGVLRAKAGHDSALGLIAKRLRSENDDIAQEPLPARFRDLVRELRNRDSIAQDGGPRRAAKHERADGQNESSA